MKFLLLNPIGYENNPRGHEPDHFAHIEATLEARGHTKLHPERANELDVLLFNSDVWNLAAGTSPYDWNVLNAVLKNHTPVVWFDNFDHGGDNISQGRWPGSDDWSDMLKCPNDDWCKFGYAISRSGANPILYFMRKMQIHQGYPKWVLPLEYPLFEDHLLVSAEELFRRPNDVCGLANISLPRTLSMIGLLRDGRLKADVEIIPHYRRLDHRVWMERHRQAKLFLEADASLGSERPLKLITVAPMLRIKSDHRLPFPRQDMVHMIEIGDYDGHISRQDVDKVLSVVNDRNLLHKIYVTGAEHMRAHYSLEARSKYVVDMIENFLKFGR